MTDSEPTQEEKDRALAWAKLHAEPPHPGIARDGMTNIAARCHLHATAELARAKERIRDLESMLMELKERMDYDD